LTFVDEFLQDRFDVPLNRPELYRLLEEAPSIPSRPPTTADFAGTLWIVPFLDPDHSLTLVALFRPDSFPSCTGTEVPVRWVLLDDEGGVIDRMECSWSRDESRCRLWVRRVPARLLRGALAFGPSPDCRAVRRFTIDGSVFLDDSLRISGVMWTLPDTMSPDAPVPVFERNGRRLIPLCAASPPEDGRLGVYFEVYNLRLRGGRHLFQVSLGWRRSRPPARGGVSRWFRRLFSRARPPEGLVQTFTVEGTGDRARLWLVLNLPEPTPARPALEIHIVDRIAGRESLFREPFPFSGDAGESP
jgi:hypothetical protein